MITRNRPKRGRGAGGGGIPAWAPADDAQALLALEADTGAFNTGSTQATDGQTVYRWQSVVGSVKNFDQATGGSRPTFVADVIGGQPVLRFGDGVLTWLEWTGTLFSAVDNFALIFVMRSRSESLGDNTRMFGSGAAGGGGDFVVYFSPNNFVPADTGKPSLRIGVEPTTFGPVVWSGVTRSARLTFIANGTADTIDTYDGVTAGTQKSQNWNPFTGPGVSVGIGGMPSGGSFTPIDIAAIFATTDISAENLGEYETYLTDKYGVA